MSPESAFAVISIRAVHDRPGLCIPAAQNQQSFDVVVDIKILTLQTHERWSPPKASQIMLLKHAFCFVFEIRTWITILIFQLARDVALELVILCENSYHRDFKNPICQAQFITRPLDVPFLSGQISSKYFKSSDGRSLSIGMQYLQSKTL